jgi:hypothetical protein
MVNITFSINKSVTAMNDLLVVIGGILCILSFVLILIGIFYKEKTISKSTTRFKKRGQNEYAILPLRFKFDGEIEGEISVSSGELQVSIEDFFGWIPKTPISWLGGAHFKWSGNGKKNFNGKMKAGDYMFMLKTKTENVDAEMNYSITFFIPKLKSLVDLGLAFVEVSVPLLVTGFVL